MIKVREVGIAIEVKRNYAGDVSLGDVSNKKRYVHIRFLFVNVQSVLDMY